MWKKGQAENLMLKNLKRLFYTSILIDVFLCSLKYDHL